ncbi:hypothetical protein [Paenibacillus sp. YPG26]|uniref:hypothetical protein n=1 Tax=Paenibacillus sp. YPG26 TaxID=2878915 RepID=UPI00203BC3EF|nr:hypothetical protein [Paenibacillus sp. YPG26]USB33581.1 hypothetical protein LDO05_01780 [Paenibacillus sp. YPG26]
MKKKLMALLVLSSTLVGAVSVSAYSGSYSFDIDFQISGTTVHSLSNKSTSTTATAESYWHTGNVSPYKDKYSVELYKNWLTSYKVSGLVADNTTQTKNFGVISSGNYTINVVKTGGNADNVTGSGTINQ